jgi:peptidoglycan/xylan/chitin deacetylase (PgdA/CDA1 family)
VATARRLGELVPLRELLARAQAGRSTAGLIALTFDDAYAALLNVASGYLQSEAVPATVFVATDAALSGERFWWDRLEEGFSATTPEHWEDFEKACGLPEAYRRGQGAEYGRLRPFRQWVLCEHQGRWPARLERLLADLERESGSSAVQRSMTFEELHALRAAAPVDLAVHTRSHPVLPLLGRAEQVREIAGSHSDLQRHFDDVLPVLAIPYGIFDAQTAAVAREAGMLASLTLGASTLRWAPHADQLPRFCITRAESIFKLHLRLTGVADRVRRLKGESLGECPALPSAVS